MLSNNYIDKIRLCIKENWSDEERVELFAEYIRYLQGILEVNPKDISTICQLSMSYLEAWYPSADNKAIELLETTYDKYRNELNTNESIELLTNIAYFYDREFGDVKKAKRLLKKVVKLNPQLANVNDALGIIYMSENKIKEAIKLFDQAKSLDNDIHYQYNYAASIYEEGQIDRAKEIFLNISKDWRKNDITELAYFNFGMISALSGDFKIGNNVADDLRTVIKPSLDAMYVSSYELGDLYYLSNNFEECISMYEYDVFSLSLEYFGPYLYSKYKINDRKSLDKIYQERIREIEEQIESVQTDDDEYWEEESRREIYVENSLKEMNDLKTTYHSITFEKYKPIMNFNPIIITKCYYFNCPRHSIL